MELCKFTGKLNFKMQQSGAEDPNFVRKVFTFEDKKKNPGETLTVSIPEVGPQI